MNLAPEQRTALLYSVGLHVALVLLLVFSSQPGPSITPPKGIAIEAEIMDLDQFMKSQNKATPKVEKPPESKVEPKPEPKIETPPEPKVEPKPEPKIETPPEPKVEPKIEPKPVDKPVVKPEVDEQKRQEKTERQKKLEEIRRQRQEAEELAKKTPANEPKQTPSTDTSEPNSETPPVGVKNGAEDQRRTLLTQYVGAIQSAVTRQWARPSGTPAGLQCQIKVNQIPGGGVIDVSIGTPCNASAVVRNSIINAVKKADPLPYSGFEQVFDRRLNFIFQYQGD